MKIVKEVPFEYDSEKYIIKVLVDDKNYYAQVCYENGTEAYKNELSITIENDRKFQEKHGKMGIDQIVQDAKNSFIEYLKTPPSKLY
ncbi:hypothetical protein QQ008_07620 [Fulvivirgaceae bacterium BMA10]|uniref:Uncharacterized protein n=1 Tax=Splendidivirga corallicola TaxID=3051826 RepID=A0ABT8KLW5_9BACT|nr:hypothetical protein [Fulvivirgaceae bacterium BMA10]